MAAIDPAVLELVLKTTGSEVVKDLGETIRLLKERLVELAQEYKNGQHTAEQYIDSSNLLMKALQGNEELLRRATTVEQEAAKEITALAVETEKAANAAREAAEKFEEEARAIKNMEEMALESEAPLQRLSGPPGDPEAAEHGLKAVAGGAIKAEKAIKELVEGRGIGKIGSQLEGIVSLLGGPVGLGMAIGAVIIGIKSTLPVLKEWIDSWQSASKEVEEARKAIEAFDYARKTSQEDLEKRELAKMKKSLMELEEVERQAQLPGGSMTTEDVETLHRLRIRIAAAEEESGIEKQLARIGPTKAQKKLGTEAEEAITEAGGVEAVIGKDAGIVARRVVVSAMKGDLMAIGTLRRWSPDFARVWEEIHTDESLAIQQQFNKMQEEQLRDPRVKESVAIQQQFNKVYQEQLRDRRENKASAAMEARDIEIQFDKDQEDKAKKENQKRDHDSKEAERKAKEAERKAKEEYRESLPSTQLHEQRKGLEEEALAYAGIALPGAAPDVQQKMARHMIENYNLGRAVGHSLEEQIRYAVMQTRQDIVNGITHGIKRNHMHSETFVPPQ